ncbi:MAG: hypothetical protein QOF51_3188 [Chloroflexota bacterium]|jgi:hypothetical protein|nr:hypothetical protein [Chloroflexota bacterium]
MHPARILFIALVVLALLVPPLATAPGASAQPAAPFVASALLTADDLGADWECDGATVASGAFRSLQSSCVGPEDDDGAPSIFGTQVTYQADGALLDTGSLDAAALAATTDQLGQQVGPAGQLPRARTSFDPVVGDFAYWLRASVQDDGRDLDVIVVAFRVGSYGAGTYAVGPTGTLDMADMVIYAGVVAERMAVLPPVGSAAPTPAPTALPTPAARPTAVGLATAPPAPGATSIPTVATAPVAPGAPTGGGGITAARAGCPAPADLGPTWQELPNGALEKTSGSITTVGRGLVNPAARTGAVGIICVVAFMPSGTAPGDSDVLSGTQAFATATVPGATEISGPPVGQATHWFQGQDQVNGQPTAFLIVGFRAGGALALLTGLGDPGRLSPADVLPAAQITANHLTANPPVASPTAPLPAATAQPVTAPGSAAPFAPGATVVPATIPTRVAQTTVAPAVAGRANPAAARADVLAVSDLGAGWRESATSPHEDSDSGFFVFQRAFGATSARTGPRAISSAIILDLSSIPATDSDVGDVMQSIIGKYTTGQGTSEVAGPAVGQGTRWAMSQYTSSDGNTSDEVLVAFRAGGAVAFLYALSLPGQVSPGDLAPLAQIVAGRMTTNPPIGS